MKRMRMLAIIAGMLVLRFACNLAAPAVHPTIAINFKPAPTPSGNVALTSTRQVTSLALAPDGVLWVGTSGGVLRRDQDGTWHKFTRLAGLPAHEVRGFRFSADGSVEAVCPRNVAVWQAGQWQVQALSDGTQPEAVQAISTADGQGLVQKAAMTRGAVEESKPPLLPTVTWRGALLTADLTGLHIQEHGTVQHVALPPSQGTHISALLPQGNALWAALFGDGLWSFDGHQWQPLKLELPPQAREITALAGDAKSLWLGTRRDGVWQYQKKQWTQYLQPDEPYDHNCQNLATFHGALLVSTLEDGLAMQTGTGWQHIGSETLSSNAPRQIVEFNGSLWVRQGTGKVDRFDGEHWIRNALPWLPRQKAMTLAADHQRLYVAQWGGWSEFDGTAWKHHFDVPELQGLPLTVLYPEGDTLWIGTQSRGIGKFNRTTGKLLWHDERMGLPDDWITCMARVGNALYAGTFVGGLARCEGEHWQTYPELQGENVTALEPDGAAGVFIATRTGLWHETVGKLLKVNQQVPFLDTEVQSLKRQQNGLWVGTRTGLYYLTEATLHHADNAPQPKAE
ncbi:MAG: hypothetical protein JO316_04160 [Abitibacteriaceae bacterium]|nr:hypothetical protein [Abditibacteriaceae bacterium]